jgi:rare lipoprotein A
LAVAVLVNLLAIGLAEAPVTPQGSASSTWEQPGSAQQAAAPASPVPASSVPASPVQALHGRRLSPGAALRIDRSGRPRIGVASYYASYFSGRKMADGGRMDPHGRNAASRTLPLGTLARVTNLSTHRSALVRIEDRGPYVSGRIVDLSPATARSIGITRRAGLARVRVTPLNVPHPEHSIRVASASADGKTAPLRSR